MELVQAALIVFIAFVALLGMLFVSLVAGLATVDRGRVPVASRRPGDAGR